MTTTTLAAVRPAPAAQTRPANPSHGAYIGTAKFTPDDPDGEPLLWTLRTGGAIGARAGYASLAEAERALLPVLDDANTGAAIVQRDDRFLGRVLLAKWMGQEDRYHSWSFGREDLPGDTPHLTSWKAAKAAGVAEIIDVDSYGDLIRMG